ncbi:MAG: response regulator [Anaerolineae bacterium]|nr:response regulator [Anaerolineae bacterium]
MNQTTRPPAELESLAEGAARDPQEKRAAAATGRLPAVQFALPGSSSLSETGVISRITTRPAGEDKDRTELQDASLTHAETVTDKQPAPASTPAQNTRALIVEDTVELAEVLQATLEGMGLQAIYATHGKTGLEKLKELKPALVLMDIGLPDITGWKMLDSIKEHYSGSTMPAIIVITAYGDPANRLIGKLQGIHSYLMKPFTPDEVEKLVRMALAGENPPDQNLRADQKS